MYHILYICSRLKLKFFNNLSNEVHEIDKVRLLIIFVCITIYKQEKKAKNNTKTTCW